MKKRLALILLGCLITLFLVGCNANIYRGSSDQFIESLRQQAQEQGITINSEGDLPASNGKVFKRFKVLTGEKVANLLVVSSPKGRVAQVTLTQQKAPLSDQGIARIILSTIQPKEVVDDLLSELSIGSQGPSNGHALRGKVAYSYVNDGINCSLTINIKGVK
jgi:hypothetical protein